MYIDSNDNVVTGVCSLFNGLYGTPEEIVCEYRVADKLLITCGKPINASCMTTGLSDRYIASFMNFKMLNNATVSVV